MIFTKARWLLELVVRYGTSYPNPDYRENDG